MLGGGGTNENSLTVGLQQNGTVLLTSDIWDRKMELRLKYVNERLFWVDLKLIFQTLSAIFVRK